MTNTVSFICFVVGGYMHVQFMCSVRKRRKEWATAPVLSFSEIPLPILVLLQNINFQTNVVVVRYAVQ